MGKADKTETETSPEVEAIEYATAEDLFTPKAKEIASKSVYISKWGKHVLVRELTGIQMFAVTEAGNNKSGTDATKARMAKSLEFALVQPHLDITLIRKLFDGPFAPIQQIYTAINELSGVTEEASVEAEAEFPQSAE